MEKVMSSLLVGLLFFMFLTPVSWAETQVENEDKNRSLLVATIIAPPFSMKSDEGTWYGISIDLWKIMAQRLGFEYSFKEYDLHGLLKAVENRDVDMGIAAISMTSEREKLMDFSHSYYQTGLGLVVRDIHEHSFLQVIKKLTSFKILFMISMLLMSAVLLAIVFWLLEKKTDNKYFNQGPGKGLGTAILWAIKLVISGSISVFDMKRFSSRALALILSFFGMTFIAGYTAIITSSLTVNELNSTISGPEDLPGFRVVVLADSAASEYLEYYHVKYTEVSSLSDGLNMVREKMADVVVHDKPILTFTLRSQGSKGLKVLPSTFGIEEYGIALPENSFLQEKVDQLILETIEEAEYKVILHRYLSDPT